MDRTYRDPLTEFSDEDLARLQDPGVVAFVPAERVSWWESFKYMERYDWDDPEFKKRNRGRGAFLPVPLSLDYFMLVPKSMYRKMTVHSDGLPKRWYPKIDRDSNGDIIKVYAYRNARAPLGEVGSTILAHREIVGLVDGKGVVDHANGWGLDNRFYNKKHRINLDCTSHAKNISNAFRYRKVNTDLLRGVERRGKNKNGQQLYGGGLRIRKGPKSVQCVRSKRKWTTQEQAHQWYLNQLKKRRRRENWAFVPRSVSYPQLPPLRPEFRPATTVPEFVPMPTLVVVDSLEATF